jgi:NAD(P)H-hydrate repair Nnr-like enzyme with NAD(P)H-hydrate epimerase domain
LACLAWFVVKGGLRGLSISGPLEIRKNVVRINKKQKIRIDIFSGIDVEAERALHGDNKICMKFVMIDAQRSFRLMIELP